MDEERTVSGKPITDELVAELAAKTELGYDAEEILRRWAGSHPEPGDGRQVPPGRG